MEKRETLDHKVVRVSQVAWETMVREVLLAFLVPLERRETEVLLVSTASLDLPAHLEL
ncbi:hypothetical protein LDENG_00232320, partial [Lucifuga dentata]